MKILKIIGGIFVALVIIGIFVGDDDTDTNSSSKGSNAISLVETKRPQIQKDFVNIVSTAQNESKNTENDMQKGGIISARDKNLCNLLGNNSQITNWTGTVKKISSNSDGKGVLFVEIAKKVQMQTWNNAFSDIGDKTLIEPETELFNSAASLKKGQEVVFSGSIFFSKDGCVKEQSLSLRGKLESPGFTFKFSKIAPLN